MDEELKKALEQSAKDFTEFKKINDDRIKLLESKGHAPADYEEKLAKVNKALDEAEDKRKHAQDELEKKLNRLSFGSAGTKEADEQKSTERRSAFNAFVRKGDQSLSEPERRALAIANDPTGGYLAIPEYVNSIIKAVVLFSPMRSLVNVIQTGTNEVIIPKRTQTAAATWVGETTTRTESQNPNWGLVRIPVHEMYAEARVTNANLEDSAYDLEGQVTGEFGEQFGVTEGTALISGNGVGKPLGFLDANAAGPSTPIAYTPSGVAATISGAAAGAAGQADPLITLFHSVKTAYAANASWALTRNSLGKVRKLKDTNGQYLWQPGIGANGVVANGIAPTILNAPYTECPDMDEEGANKFPIAFGDWKRAITMVDRIGIAIVRDPYSLGSVSQVKFSARRRIGAQVVLGEAIRLLKCATS